MLYGRISVPHQTLGDAWRLVLSLFFDNEVTPEHTIFLKYREQDPPFFVGTYKERHLASTDLCYR